MRKIYLLLFLTTLLFSNRGYAQIPTPTNSSFESDGASVTNPTGWSVFTNACASYTSATVAGARTGSYTFAYQTACTTTSNVNLVSSSISVANNGYFHAIGWAGASTSRTRVVIGYYNGTTYSTLAAGTNPSTIGWTQYFTQGQNTSGSAKSYSVWFSDYSSNGASQIGYFDDIVTYTDNTATTDITAPNTAPSGFTTGTVGSSSVAFTWTNGSDLGTGVKGYVILRAPSSVGTGPTLNNQGLYSAAGGTSGPNIDVSGNWTIIGLGSGASNGSAGSYTDNTVAAGTSYKYAIINFDLAYNYSTALVSATITPPGISVSTATLAVNGYNQGFGPLSPATSSFTVSGAGLTANLGLSATSDYQISTSSTTGFASTLSLTPSSGTVASTTIYVRHISGLTAGNYNISEAVSVSSTGVTTKTVTLTGTIYQPNNDCAGAINVPLNSGSTCTLSTSGTSLYTSQTATACSGTADDDVWFSYTPTTTAYFFTITPVTMSDVVAQFYTGTCSGLASLGCVDNTGGSNAETVSVSGLTPGTTYYFRVHSYGSGTGAGSFTICGTNIAPSITSFTPTGGCTGSSVVITGTNFTGATAVSIGGTAVTSYTVNSSTQITATVGTGTTGTISVTTPYGTATSGAATYTITSPTATWASAAVSVCPNASLQTTTLAYSATTNAPTTYSITWNASPANSFSPVTNQSFAGTSTGGTINISVPAGTNSGTYTGTITVSNGTCTSSSSSFTVTVKSTPSAITITPGSTTTFCSGSSVTLTASGGDIGASSLATQGSATYISTASTSFSTLGPNPMESYYGGSKQQMLLTKTELNALGLVSGSLISSIAFDMAAVETRTLQNFAVKMQNSSLTSFSSTSFVTSGLTTVRNAANLTPVAGWNTITLNTPFTWDGVNSLLIETNFSNNDGGGTGSNTAYLSATSFNSSLFYRVDNATAATVDAATTASFTAYAYRDDIRLGFTVSPASYIWSPPTGLNTTSGATVIASPTSSQSYSVSSTISGCSSGNSVSITVTQPPTANSGNNAATTICSNGTYTVTNASVANNASFSWSATNGNGGFSSTTTLNPTYTPNATDITNGTVTLTLTATGNGTCGNTTSTKVLTITSAPAANSGNNSSTTICSNGTYTVTNASVTNNASFSWSATNGNGGFSSTTALNPVYTPNATDIANGTVTLTLTATGNSPCGNTTSLKVLTIVKGSSATGMTANASATSICAAGTVHLTQSGGVLGTGAYFEWSTSSTFAAGTIVGTSTASDGAIDVIVTSNTTFYVRINGGTAPCSTGALPASGPYASVTVAATTDIWLTTAGNTNWFDPANWCGGVPDKNTNVLIPVALNYPMIPDLTNGVAYANNITLAVGVPTPTSLTVSGTGVLSLHGSFTNLGGIVDLTDGTLRLAGSGQQISGSTFKDRTLKNLIDSTSASLSATTDDTLNITGKFSFGNINGDPAAVFATNGNLTLKSSATATASIADITNNGAVFTGGSNSISGTANVERYVPATRKWRFMAVNTTGGNTSDFTNSWMEGQTAGTPTSTGFGMWITDPAGTGYGFDASSPGATIKWWNTSASAYVSIGNTNFNMLDPLAHGAFMTFVRGDRSATGSGTGASVSTSTVLRTKGNLVQGTPTAISIPPAPVGIINYTAVGNPYASAIDLSKLTYSNTTNVISIAIWDPNGTGSTYGLGAFKYLYKDPISSGGDGNFHMTFGGGSYPDINAGSDIMNTIESGQAFFISGTGTTQTLQFNEKAKTPKIHDVYFTPGHEQVITGLFLIKDATGVATILDGVRVKFNAAYTNAVNANDAIKLGNTSENISVKYDNKLLAIHNRALPDELDTVQLNIANLRAANYQWKMNLSNMDQPGRAAFLVDRYLNIETPLNLTGSTTYDFPVVNIAGSYATNRFLIVFRPALAGPLPVTLTGISATRLADKTIAVKWNTENEIAINHYELQRSGDGRNFISIASDQLATNNTGGSANYSKIDMAPLNGDNYYRIKAISNNGRVQYSAIVKVDPLVKEASISIYPNPLTDRVMNLKFAGEAAGKYQLQLSDKAGKTVYTNTITITDGNEIRSLDIGESLRAGAYDLLIIGADGKKTVKEIVLE